MDPPDDPLAYKDAVFISPHKFIGGPGTPGRARRPPRAVPEPRARACPAAAPSQYVNPFEHVYLSDIEHREEGGTPAIVESIRAGPRVPAQGGRGRRGDPRARARLHPPRDARAGRPTRRSRSSAAPTRTGCRSCRSSSATTAATCTTTSSSPCSTTCSGSSRAAAARAPGRTGTACSASTSRPRTSSSARSRAAARGSSPAGSGSTSTTSSARRCSSSCSTPSTSWRRDGWRLLPDYAFEPGDRPVAPPRGPPGAAARACATSATTTGGWPGRRTATTSPSRGSPGTSTRRASSSTRPVEAPAAPSLDAGEVGPDFEALRWFWLPEEVAAAADRRACLRARRRVPAVLGIDLGHDRGEGGAAIGLDGRLLGPRAGGLPDGRRRRRARGAGSRATGGRRSRPRRCDRCGGGRRARCAGDLRRGAGADARRGRRVRGARATGDHVAGPAPTAGGRAGSGCCRRWRGWRARSRASVERAALAARGVGRARACGCPARRRRRSRGTRRRWTRRRCWPPACGRRSCPRPGPFGSPLGELRPDAAEALGLRAGIPVIAGVNDGTASHARRGPPCAGRRRGHGRRVGRAGHLRRPRDRGGRAVRRAGAAARPMGRGRGDGRPRRVGRLAARGRAPRRGRRPRTLLAEAAAVPAGAGGLVFLPYLAGERAPLFDEEARGAFVGLTLGHGRAELARAVLEGAAFAMRSVAEPLAAAGAPIRVLRLGRPPDAGRRLGADQGRRPRRAGRDPVGGGVGGPRRGDPGRRGRGGRRRPRVGRGVDDVGRRRASSPTPRCAPGTTSCTPSTATCGRRSPRPSTPSLAERSG